MNMASGAEAPLSLSLDYYRNGTSSDQFLGRCGTVACCCCCCFSSKLKGQTQSSNMHLIYNTIYTFQDTMEK